MKTFTMMMNSDRPETDIQTNNEQMIDGEERERDMEEDSVEWRPLN